MYRNLNLLSKLVSKGCSVRMFSINKKKTSKQQDDPVIETMNFLIDIVVSKSRSLEENVKLFPKAARSGEMFCMDQKKTSKQQDDPVIKTMNFLVDTVLSKSQPIEQDTLFPKDARSGRIFCMDKTSKQQDDQVIEIMNFLIDTVVSKSQSFEEVKLFPKAACSERMLSYADRNKTPKQLINKPLNFCFNENPVSVSKQSREYEVMQKITNSFRTIVEPPLAEYLVAHSRKEITQLLEEYFVRTSSQFKIVRGSILKCGKAFF